jgi:hypothetical protein
MRILAGTVPVAGSTRPRHGVSQNGKRLVHLHSMIIPSSARWRRPARRAAPWPC